VSASLRKGWCPGALRPMQTGDGLLVRLRITGGIVPLAMAEALAEASRRFGNGVLDLSARANLQIRGVSEATLPGLTGALADLGLLDDAAEAEAVRNVLASPLAGLDPTALLDIRSATRVLEQQLVSDPLFQNLPPKFYFVLDDGGATSLAEVAADIRFDAMVGSAGPLFRVSLGGTAVTARPVALCTPAEVPDVTARLVRAFLACRGTGPDAPRRMRDLLASGVDLPPALAHANLPPWPTRSGAPEACVGLFHAGPLPVLGLGAPFGRLSADGLARLAQEASPAGASEVRLTPWRSFLVPGGDPERVPAMLHALAPFFITRPEDPRLAVAACSGAPGCQRASTPIHHDAAILAPSARALAGRGISLHLSGCPKGCAHPGPSRATLVAEAGRYGLVLDGTAQNRPVLQGLTLAEALAALQDMATGRLPGAHA
jgi:precorrin-3B synthase